MERYIKSITALNDLTLRFRTVNQNEIDRYAESDIFWSANKSKPSLRCVSKGNIYQFEKREPKWRISKQWKRIACWVFLRVPSVTPLKGRKVYQYAREIQSRSGMAADNTHRTISWHKGNSKVNGEDDKQVNIHMYSIASRKIRWLFFWNKDSTSKVAPKNYFLWIHDE